MIYHEHPAASRRYETTKAGDAVRALKASLRPQATARRDGVWQTLDAAALVPGDLVLLASGSHVPADCRVRAAVLGSKGMGIRREDYVCGQQGKQALCIYMRFMGGSDYVPRLCV